MPIAEINDINIYYEDHGTGYPVVFLHGFSLTHHMWEDQVKPFSEQVRFITYDARGHGRSSSPPEVDQYSADIVVEDLYQLLKYLDIEKAVIGGLSMGGYQSLRFYLTHPEMVTALICMDTGPGFRNLEARGKWNARMEKQGKKLESEGPAFMAPGAPNEICKAVMLEHNPIGLAHMARTVVGQHDSWVIDSLPEVHVPTLVLVGENDEAFLAAGQVMAKKIPNSEHVLVPNAGHHANIDNTDFFNQAVLEFLKRFAG